jgi:hypothetical protein
MKYKYHAKLSVVEITLPPSNPKISRQKITPKFPPEIQPPKLLRFFSRYNFAKKIKIAKNV